ncbi:MAG: hypothetical protein ABI378_12375 [Chitinophagaceae bacterium]
MDLLRIEILNPKALQLIKDMQDLGLIRLSVEPTIAFQNLVSITEYAKQRKSSRTAIYLAIKEGRIIPTLVGETQAVFIDKVLYPPEKSMRKKRPATLSALARESAETYSQAKVESIVPADLHPKEIKDKNSDGKPLSLF